MITAFQATRIAGLLYSKPSCVANAALPRPLGAKSTHAVLCLRPGKRKHVQKGTLKTYSESQAINFQSGSGSNAQPTVQFPVESIKSNLQREIDGTKRGIFGTKASVCALFKQALLVSSLPTSIPTVIHCASAAVVQAAKSQAIEDLLQQLEEQTPALNVTEAMDQLNGGWQLLYTSLTIKVDYQFSAVIQAQALYIAQVVTGMCLQGARKTKLGLREFVTLGDFRQTVDTGTNRAVRPLAQRVIKLSQAAKSTSTNPKTTPDLPNGWADMEYKIPVASTMYSGGACSSCCL